MTTGRLEHAIPDSSPSGREAPNRPAKRPLDPLDAALGERVRRLRVARGLSSRQLGEAIGVSLQQVRRYETGADRMSAATLIRICVALRTSVAVVCEGLDRQGAAESVAPPAPGTAERLVADFTAIRQSAVRTNLCRLVASMAAASAEEPPSA